MGFTVALQTGAKDVHSGTTGGAARNPIGELAALIAACVRRAHRQGEDPRLLRRRSKPDRRRDARASRAPASRRKRFKAAHELHEPAPAPRPTSTSWRRSWRGPPSRCTAWSGGYSGPGIKTIVPHRAEAKLSTRLVPDQKPAKIFKLIKRFIKSRCPDAVVTHEASLEPYLAPLGGPYNAAAAAAMRETFGKEPGFTREGGSIGAVLTMRRLLKAPVTFMGLSLPEHGYHAINENYDWGQASGGMEMFCRYFHKIAELGRPGSRNALKPRLKLARAR